MQDPRFDGTHGGNWPARPSGLALGDAFEACGPPMVVRFPVVSNKGRTAGLPGARLGRGSGDLGAHEGDLARGDEEAVRGVFVESIVALCCGYVSGGGPRVEGSTLRGGAVSRAPQ